MGTDGQGRVPGFKRQVCKGRVGVMSDKDMDLP